MADVVRRAFALLSRVDYDPLYRLAASLPAATAPPMGTVGTRVRVLDLLQAGLLPAGTVLSPERDDIDAVAEIDEQGQIMYNEVPYDTRRLQPLPPPAQPRMVGRSGSLILREASDGSTPSGRSTNPPTSKTRCDPGQYVSEQRFREYLASEPLVQAACLQLAIGQISQLLGAIAGQLSRTLRVAAIESFMVNIRLIGDFLLKNN